MDKQKRIEEVKSMTDIIRVNEFDEADDDAENIAKALNNAGYGNLKEFIGELKDWCESQVLLAQDRARKDPSKMESETTVAAIFVIVIDKLNKLLKEYGID